MKFQLLLVVLLGVLLPVMACADKVVLKPIRADIELEEEEEDEEEWDLEKEVFGPHMQRFEGINILDENLEVILTDPSERVLRALESPMEDKNALTLEKVKAMYREQMEKQQNDGHQKSATYTQEDFEKMLAREQKVAEKEAAAKNSVFKRVLDYIW